MNNFYGVNDDVSPSTGSGAAPQPWTTGPYVWIYRLREGNVERAFRSLYAVAGPLTLGAWMDDVDT